MNSKFEDSIIINRDAVTIGSYLLDLIGYGKNEFRLPIQKTDPFSKYKVRADNSLLHGNTGISLFLLELYISSKDVFFKNAAKKIIQEIITYENKYSNSNHYGFYRGKMGIVYVLTKFYEVTKEIEFINYAVELTKGCDSFISSEYSKDNLYEGISGTLLGLMYLYQFNQSENILNYINLAIEKLLIRWKFSQKGIYWDVANPFQKFPLGGYGNGVAGISYTLVQLSHFFKEGFYQEIAVLGNNYLDSQWDALQNCWKNHTVFNHPEYILQPDMPSSWHSGNLGILFSNPQIDKLLLIKNDILTTKHLCSIDCMTAYMVYPDLGDIFFDKLTINKGSLSLYDGLAGLGYLNLVYTGQIEHSFLKIEPHKVSNDSLPIFKPKSILKTYIKNFLANHFRRTIIVLNEIAPLSYKEFINTCNIVDPDEILYSFELFLKKKMNESKNPLGIILMDCLEYEIEIIKNAQSLKSNIDLYFRIEKTQQIVDYLYSIPENEIFNCAFVMREGNIIMQSKWNWHIPFGENPSKILENLDSPPDEHYVLLKPILNTKNTYEEIYLADWYLLILEMQTPIKAETLFEAILESFQISNELYGNFRKKFVDIFIRFTYSGYIDLKILRE